MSDTTNTTENMEQVTEQEKEMQEAQASGVVNFDDKKKDLSLIHILKVIKQSIVNTYASKTGKKTEDIEQLMSNETWWTGDIEMCIRDRCRQ